MTYEGLVAKTSYVRQACHPREVKLHVNCWLTPQLCIHFLTHNPSDRHQRNHPDSPCSLHALTLVSRGAQQCLNGETMSIAQPTGYCTPCRLCTPAATDTVRD